MTVEDDYGMIDGIINNGPKEPTVAQLEQQARSGQPISLMDLAAAVIERNGKEKVRNGAAEKPAQTGTQKDERKKKERGKGKLCMKATSPLRKRTFFAIYNTGSLHRADRRSDGDARMSFRRRKPSCGN